MRDSRRVTWRIGVLAAVLGLSTLGLVYRLVDIQLVNHGRYRLEAAQEHHDKRLVRSSRGAILDRNGFPFATSIDVFDLYVDRRAWRGDLGQARVASAGLSPLVNRPPEALLGRLADASNGPIELLEAGIDFETGRQIEGLRLPGIVLAPGTKRFYPEGDVASGVLGFLGREHSGLAGLEADLDEVLAGKPGALYFERDGSGRPIPVGESRFEPGEQGADVRLTIDRYSQRLIDLELDQQIRDHRASGGAIIVMEPKTGAILGITSRPSFRLSDLSLDAPKQELYRNRAVTDVYEPGSVLKTITMATAIDLGLVTPGTTYYDSGTVEKGGYTFKNWDFSAHGVTTMTQLLQKSLNTGAIWLSDRIGPDRLYDSIKRFGFGQPTHSGLGGEAAGLVRTNKDAGWYSADLATNSYGQGIAATPLQVITAFSAVVNGGNLMRPYIIEEVDTAKGRRKYEPVVVRRVISPDASRTMVQMLNDVVDGVRFHRAQVKGYNVGGKTGTTLVSIPTGYALDSTLATFVGFAPAEDPAIIMLVKIDTPQDDPLGGIVAAPVFGRLAPAILTYLNVRPSSQNVRSGP